MTLDNKRFVPTELGEIVIDILKEFFPEIIDLEFTVRRWRKTLTMSRMVRLNGSRSSMSFTKASIQGWKKLRTGNGKN